VNQRYRPITRLGLGGTGLGDMYHSTTDAAGHATVDAAWDAGIRYFDTAPHYGAGLSEHRFGQALRRHPRHEYTLSTKVGRLLAPHLPGEIEAPFVGALPFRRVIDYTADGVRRSVEDSLQRLALGTIDIVYVHDLSPDMFGSDFERHYRTAAGKGGAFEGMVKLREEGIIKAWGLGVNTVEPCLRALRDSDPDIFLLAGRYTLMETTPLQEMFPYAPSAAPTWCWAAPSTPASWPAASITTIGPPARSSASAASTCDRWRRAITSTWPRRRCSSASRIRWWRPPFPAPAARSTCAAMRR